MEQFAVSGTRKPLTEVQKNDIIENLQLERELRELEGRTYRLKGGWGVDNLFWSETQPVFDTKTT